MDNITSLFNKSATYLLACLGLAVSAYAQCPANITVNNTPGSCGATVTYAVTPAGGGNGQSVNGVVNPSAGNGFGGWTVTNGGDGWVESGAYFLSSYELGTMSQVIDLTTMGMTDAYMDTQPAITVSEDYIGWFINYADYYSLTVQLRGEADNVIASYTTGTLTTTANLQTASHVFTGYGTGVRKVYIAHTGDDVEYWAGQYGAAVTNVQCTVAVPTGTVVQTGGLASGAVFPIGTTTNTFELTDTNNVVTTCSFDVTVVDNQAPTITLNGGATATLNENGEATITLEDIDISAVDNCTANTVTLSIPPTSYTCANLGMNALTVTASDGTNMATQVVYVNVTDAIDPILTLQPAVLILDNEGMATLTQADVDNGSTDNCAISSFTFSQAMFSCEEMGEHTIMVTAADASGNTTTAEVLVSVADNTPPVLALQNVTLVLGENGTATLSQADADTGSTDNCAIDSFSFSQSEFSCDDSTATVTVTAIDTAGNVSTGQITVTIADETAPVAIAQDITLELTENATVTLNAAVFGAGSTDNCGIVDWGVNTTSFECDDIGENTVTLTVTDAAGHTATTTAVVTVTDPNNYCETSATAANFANAVTLYPNPANSVLTIAASGYSIAKVALYDLNGRHVHTINGNANGPLTVDVSGLSAGIYMVKLYSADGVAIKKLVKE
ncbi:T9SS type A sorting domain-containing protein [Flavobacterium sp. RHBU_24]|uniref:T9SS type A sorting domain-containing protein n=1 Tax=Flavobacterium sp. RHBU_24 TaxID=3391185 RepID=UPI00398482A3